MIKRRVKPGRKIKVKRRPKLSEWKRLYNRLADEDSDFGVYEEVAKHMPYGDIDCEVFDLFTEIIARFDSKIETLQVNHQAKHLTPTFRVWLTWTDYDAKPKYGYLRPKLYVVKTSTDLWRTTILAYIELCDHARKWL